MRILQLISSGGYYGAENVVAALGRSLQEMGHGVQVGVFENAHCPATHVAESFEARGLRVTRLLCRGRFDLRAMHAIRNLALAEHLDILHSHGYKADTYGYLASRGLQLPIVSTRHNHFSRFRKPAIRLYELLDSLLLRRFDAVAAVSDSIAQEMRGAGIAVDRLATIENGIDLTAFEPAAAVESRSDQIVIGTVARLVSGKGIEIFLQAASTIANTNPAVIFAVAGEGPERERLQRLAMDLNIQGRTRFLGQVQDMPKFYASLDIFVLPSLDEGMPMCILEAMAAGKPVIATNVGQVAKIVEPGVGGLIIAPGNVPELADALCRLLKDPVRRAYLGENGRKKAHGRFSATAMADRYLNLYQRALESRFQQSGALVLQK